MYLIKNDILQVTVSAKGAELQTIYNTETQLNYLWNGDPAFWGKKSPVLFPIVGGLANNTYQYKGIDYKLNRHGFARESDFTVTAQSADSITFTLEASKETLQVYPFLFRFSVQYALDQNKVRIGYLVENTGKEPMYFSVGAHPAFAVPVVNGTAFSDYRLLFGEKETAGKWPLTTEGLIQASPVSFLNDTRVLPLTKELFYADALVFKHLKSKSISIVSDKTSHGVQVDFSDFPYMGIWNAKNADFVCIEPWCGIADSVLATGDITKKEGIHALASGDQFARSWQIQVS